MAPTRTTFFIFIFVLFGVGGYVWYAQKNDMPLIPNFFEQSEPVIRVGNVPVRVEIADTASSRERGLSGRASLGETDGMFFIFDRADYYAFHMKDMQFPIDIIWIDENLRVVDITRQLSPDTYPRQFEPSVPVRFVLEVNARYAESFSIAVGDLVTIPNTILPEDLRDN